MRIVSLNLVNFQKHTNLTLDFQDGVNYVYGSSDAGKSCIRRAIGFLFFGDPRNDDIRKEGTKQTSVTAILDNGTEVERVKSATVNRYIIRKDGTEVTYDSIGASIPDEVKRVLQVSTIDIDKEQLNLNIAEQISLPFLLDKPGSFRLKLFNKLTGSDLIDKIIQNFNKSLLSIGRDVKTEQEFITLNEQKLSEVTQQFQTKKTVLGKVQDIKLKLDDKVEKYNKLNELQTKINVVNTDIAKAKEVLANIKIISDEVVSKIKILVDKHVSLSDLKEALLDTNNQITETLSKVKTLKVSDIDISSIKEKVSKLEVLKKAQNKLLEAHGNVISTNTAIGASTTKISELEVKYDTLLKEAGVCPVCKQDTSKCKVYL